MFKELPPTFWSLVKFNEEIQIKINIKREVKVLYYEQPIPLPMDKDLECSRILFLEFFWLVRF